MNHIPEFPFMAQRMEGEREHREASDPVSHPAHYTDGKIEVIDFIEDKGLNFHRGNAVKYIARAGKKDPTKEIEDLKKRGGISIGKSIGWKRRKRYEQE